ncbi:NAD(P)H-quinone oxidoreductase subunit 2 B chloroplastic [Bienertia sinuspersici]
MKMKFWCSKGLSMIGSQYSVRSVGRWGMILRNVTARNKRSGGFRLNQDKRMGICKKEGTVVVEKQGTNIEEKEKQENEKVVDGDDKEEEWIVVGHKAKHKKCSVYRVGVQYSFARLSGKGVSQEDGMRELLIPMEALIFITVGIGFKLSPAPSHQWTPDVYEGMRFV